MSLALSRLAGGMLGGAGPAVAQDPQVTSLFPMAGSRGTTVDLEIRGNNLVQAAVLWADCDQLRASVQRVNEVENPPVHGTPCRASRPRRSATTQSRILAGTDCGCTDTPLDSLVDELQAYASEGMSTLEALQSVTAAGAEILGLKDVGEVGVGGRADLILLEQNPVDDLDGLRRPWMV